MKAGLPQKEPDMLKFWGDKGIYPKIKLTRQGMPKYVLHDGPPYANGHIHIGHALNKILKDIVIRYKTMRGYYCEFIPGWDCHGLPVEHELFKKMNKRKADVSQVEFRKKAYDYAMGFVDVQRQEFKRLGIFGEWDEPYLTTDKSYESSIIRSLAGLVRMGYIYQGRKPVNWCYRCETALAEAEVEYENRVSPSVYVKFKMSDKGKKALPAAIRGKNNYILIWTTTPWTLAANVAVAVHPASEYIIVEADGENIIMASALLEKVCAKTGFKGIPVVASLKGKDLEGMSYEHPFGYRQGIVVLADYVSMQEGTGCVHTAPGHGQDDYNTGRAYGLEVIMPVDERGVFTEQAGEFKGENVHKANGAIIDKLKGLGMLLFSETINHSYPHCWRCKTPIIFRATEQWFMSIDHNGLRGAIGSAIKEVNWVPGQGYERIRSMIDTRPDWCLSRQRYWGVPIPVFRCLRCKKWIADSVAIDHFAAIAERQGSGVWFETDIKDLLPKGYKCACGGIDFEKGKDIVDVWFESGVSHQGVLKKREGLEYPCSLYLEGSDQHRGWFQSSIITSMAIDNKSAFKSVLTHGFVVDGAGRKMSKSLGNVVSPQDIIGEYGADILRLWTAFSDYNDDIRISDEIMDRLVEAYRKIRNTARFMLSNLYDFNPRKDLVRYEDMRQIDKWAVSRARRLLRDTGAFYENFQFHKVYHNLYSFCIVDMSNFYLDIVKDVLYTFKDNSPQRRSCQSGLYIILEILAKVVAPVLVFTSEEIWQSMPGAEGMPESVHLSFIGDKQSFAIDDVLENKYKRLKQVRDTALKALESSRASGMIGSSLEAGIMLYAQTDETYDFLKANEKDLAALLIVSQAGVEKGHGPAASVEDDDLPSIRISVGRAEGRKCARCWNFSQTTGAGKTYPDVCSRCHDVLTSIKGESHNG
jgi:isoleucyl-tRNA synthetase